MSDPLPLAHSFIAELRGNLSTVCLATTNREGIPEASVAATLLDADGAFIIYISGLAAHTRNLRENPRASVLLAEPETATTSALARRRLTFTCNAATVPRESTAHPELVTAFRAKFGPTIDVLAGLPDFQFVRLTPQRGRVVVGFGAAFEVDPRDWNALTPVGRPPTR
jgi:putative heme iron utilization protein